MNRRTTNRKSSWQRARRQDNQVRADQEQIHHATRQLQARQCPQTGPVAVASPAPTRRGALGVYKGAYRGLHGVWPDVWYTGASGLRDEVTAVRRFVPRSVVCIMLGEGISRRGLGGAFLTHTTCFAGCWSRGVRWDVRCGRRTVQGVMMLWFGPRHRFAGGR